MELLKGSLLTETDCKYTFLITKQGFECLCVFAVKGYRKRIKLVAVSFTVNVDVDNFAAS